MRDDPNETRRQNIRRQNWLANAMIIGGMLLFLVLLVTLR
jgi:hypothetical protein